LYKFQKTVDSQARLKVNGEPISPEIDKGFARIERKWQKGDTIELDLPMPVRRIVANPQVKADVDKVALQRGPLVFCLEWPDNDGEVLNLVIDDDAELTAEFRPDLLNGVTVITGKAQVAKRTTEGDIVAASLGDRGERHFTAIPYYAWAHRGKGQMNVWPARKPQAARPQPADTLTYKSKTTASFVHPGAPGLDAIKDQILPESSSDPSAMHLDFWPHKGTTEWIRFEWPENHEISSAQVYWFDDTGRGECKIPQSWNVLYRDQYGNFRPVQAKTPYGTAKDTFNQVDFNPVKTNAIKIEITLPKNSSAGVQEVIIE
ncbi:MAG: glycoside hydrolase family 127 protein, partial [Planctomycetota bacterium]